MAQMVNGERVVQRFDEFLTVNFNPMLPIGVVAQSLTLVDNENILKVCLCQHPVFHPSRKGVVIVYELYVYAPRILEPEEDYYLTLNLENFSLHKIDRHLYTGCGRFIISGRMSTYSFDQSLDIRMVLNIPYHRRYKNALEVNFYLVYHRVGTAHYEKVVMYRKRFPMFQEN